MGEEYAVHMHNGLLSHKMNEILMIGTRDYYIEQNNPGIER